MLLFHNGTIAAFHIGLSTFLTKGIINGAITAAFKPNPRILPNKPGSFAVGSAVVILLICSSIFIWAWAASFSSFSDLVTLSKTSFVFESEVSGSKLPSFFSFIIP